MPQNVFFPHIFSQTGVVAEVMAITDEEEEEKSLDRWSSRAAAMVHLAGYTCGDCQ